jgi:hypothetical protein
MNRADAVQLRERALSAVTSLHEALEISVGSEASTTTEQVRRGVGLAIGAIETELLSVLYRLYPDLDDLDDRR